LPSGLEGGSAIARRLSRILIPVVARKQVQAIDISLVAASHQARRRLAFSTAILESFKLSAREIGNFSIVPAAREDIAR